ncbi:MAG: cyanophycinase [Xanthomonadales bacterium]|nr:cyanophycinase [Xanthomonadales bacterium]
MPAKVPNGASRGYIIPIGGAEDRVDNTEILKRFINICGDEPTVAVIPTASALPETGPEYMDIFQSLGARRAIVMNLRTRADCDSEETRKILDSVDGVFITGGNQLRLSTTLGGTHAARMLRSRNAAGMPIAGTSAGAAIMPEHMIAGGETGATPEAEMTTLVPGLGLSNKILVDQHFRQRDRIGRLLAAISYNPFPLGLGIDEDTAAFIDGEDHVEVVGTGAVTVLDPSHLKFSSAAETAEGRAVCMIDLRLHILTPGSRYDINSRLATPPDNQMN